MLMRHDIQLQTMIRAMVDTVAPAVDPENALAQEQCQLVIGVLTLMAEQLPLQYRFDCDELTRLIAFADEFHAALQDCAGTVADELAGLTAAAVAGTELGSRPTADPIELVTAAREIRAALDRVVDTVFTDDRARSYRTVVHRIVLERSRSEILRDRCWARTQGFEPDADDLPAIESLLSPATFGQAAK